MQQRLPSLRRHPILFAHRGARAHAPENTIPAFALALDKGATGLESDVWSTSDGVAVLDHDGVVRGKMRSRSISSVRRTDLPAHVPSFAEVIAELGRDYEFSLDVKDPSAVEPLARAVSESGFDPSRLWLCSPDLEVLGSCGRSIPGAPLVNSTRIDRIAGGLELHMSRCAAAGISAVNLHHTQWSGGNVTLVHRFGLLAFAWDLQYEEPLRNVIRMGMDAVYSDDVDLMTRVFADEAGDVTDP